ncbi:Glucose oxidase [Fulvia fulva]|uniref:Glucose oxidase n=1 Tax=Passalora fulva TaxID=5499 RepID=A0A9Q8LFF3_PASFU|nr:Glucose oxidase [Fulvia fulva]KAK4626412.1 Glucose oxidase [Fulvia fulva]KAK4628491.1 Glucose oxidase [Fulvia fulva]UJO16462.1 Glucose oxidase [Fulvia fulva]WPV13582.1 Glucose oxidase [Fulvia fulva]WPV28817.1 Glucose oxidase [Fulvia fulva]
MKFSITTVTALAASLTHALPSGYQSAIHNGTTMGITNSSSTIANQTFDYVIAGGGLTGLVVASRLTEDPKVSVLVIEAGHDNHADPRINDVRNYGQSFSSERLDHQIYSTPIESQDGNGLQLVAGKTLGGSGSINGASWTKGARSQYDVLPLLTGDDSWGWNEFNKYMLVTEDFHVPTAVQRDTKGAHYDSLYHGYGGPIDVSFAANMFAGTQLPAVEASQRVWENLTRNSDAASGVTTGATIIPNMLHFDEWQNRSSAFTQYAQHQVQQRQNFVILTGHRVTQIVWKQDDGELIADGVHFQESAESTIHTVKARREVLLAAGSLQSPQILELSGVGDPAILQAAGITPKLNLAGVGKHMQEQTKNTLTFTAHPETDHNGTGPPSAIAFPSARQLLRSRAEEMYSTTTAGLADYANQLQSEGLVADADATHTILQTQLQNLFETTDSAAAEVFFTINPTTDQVGIDNWNLIVLSRGTCHINSSDPWQHPTVNPSYFRHPLDLTFQVAVNQQSREVFETEPLSNYVVDEVTPGKSVVPEGAGESEWEEWVKGSFTSVWHYVATLAMMKEEMGGVVDSRLKVYGIGNVRAVDASVVPIQLSAHLSSSLFGLAEKAAAMIKEDWE